MGVNQLLTLFIQPHQRQTQQGRVRRVKLQPLAARQQLQLASLIGAPAPVQHGQRQLQCALHHLHRLRGARRPMEAAAQNRVCVQSRLPRLRQTRRVQPGGFHAELVDIRARQRLVHTVEQQPALHR